MTIKKAAPDMPDAEFVEWVAALPAGTLMCTKDRSRLYRLARSPLVALASWLIMTDKEQLVQAAKKRLVTEVTEKLT